MSCKQISHSCGEWGEEELFPVVVLCHSSESSSIIKLQKLTEAKKNKKLNFIHGKCWQMRCF